MLINKKVVLLINIFNLIFLINHNLFAQKPNIIFILADDLGWADLPVYGNKFNEAPHLEQLARDGMTFKNAYAAGPVCSPTRASLMSGQYPARVGVIDFIPGHWRPFEEVIVPTNRTQHLPEKIFTIGEAVKGAGYVTGYFGKWHLGNRPELHPINRGFDVANVGEGYFNVNFDPPRKDSSQKIFSERLTDFGIDFIEKNKKKPFFLFLSHYDVHVQLDANMETINKYLKKDRIDNYPGNAVYAAMIENLDNSVGRIVEKLNKSGLSENTIIVFFSDNGGLIGRYDQIPLLAQSKLDIYKDSPLKYIASSNAPLRGEKGTVYEGGIREPLIIKWPGKVDPGSISNAIVSSVDFYPTILDVVGALKPPGQLLDGKSILPELLEDKFNAERAIFWHYPVYHHGEPAGAIRKGDWKLIENQVTGKSELYNLKADISEAMDLSLLYTDKKEELMSLLKAWQKDVGAEFPVPNPNFDIKRRKEWGIHPYRQ